MQCINHPGSEAQFYCQNCGKALCAACVRKTPSGHILCESCVQTGVAADPAQAYWQAFVTPPRGVPNPSAAAVLGLIPGVGAMYNGQLFKGLIHVIIFAVLVSIAQHYHIFGLFVAAWILYQSFEAYHTAKARRDGLPVPDPFGLNELGSWLNLGTAARPPIHPGQAAPATPPPPAGAGMPGAANPGSVSPGPVSPGPAYPGPAYPGSAYPGWTDPVSTYPGSANPGSANPGSANPGSAYSAGSAQTPYGAPYTSSWGPGYTPPPYTDPYTGQGAGADPLGAYPPPPVAGRGREPVWAFILIGLGIIFLLQSMGWVSDVFHFAWPIAMIGLGVYLIVTRMGSSRGGSK